MKDQRTRKTSPANASEKRQDGNLGGGGSTPSSIGCEKETANSLSAKMKSEQPATDANQQPEVRFTTSQNLSTESFDMLVLHFSECSPEVHGTALESLFIPSSSADFEWRDTVDGKRHFDPDGISDFSYEIPDLQDEGDSASIWTGTPTPADDDFSFQQMRDDVDVVYTRTPITDEVS